ncbi:protein WHAT'S THIS FACTOR 9, mitochondrial-like [Mangifera indica]|uniref:protein WHAT'S THIS FACTOR 9, mitochondrial-like n=1 Tax=Mangifera indica TaxID=29780 RepID=UPI001CFC2F28|nr:protein WHAT'S THIS FACTOR 9, mitochondrial-like [Mangifera indica]
MRWFKGFFGRTASSRFLCECQRGVNYQQKFGLVNVKLKWVKDKSLDAVVAGERDLRAACILVSVISSVSHHFVPIYHLSRHRGQLNLPQDLKLSTFIRKYPTIFHESHVLDSGGTRVPAFGLTPEAVDLHEEELNVIQQSQKDILERLCKLLMLTKDKTLPLQTIDQLKWDMGLPYDYQHSVVPNHPGLLSMVHLPDDRLGLKLLFWDDHLAVSQLQKNSVLQQKETDNNRLAFPVRFTRGFGLKRKCMKWLEKWQMLPYTSPYTDASHLDPRTDVSEKRIVGVFHELLHLTIQKKTERNNVSNLRKPLSLPQKFTKVFERHPGIFYISKKGDTQTIVLREAYDHQQLLQKHPLVEIREKYKTLMIKGFLDKSRGLYKKKTDADQELICNDRLSDIGYSSELESDGNLLSEYDSDDPAQCAS